MQFVVPSFRAWLVALPLAMWPQLADADQCQWIEESAAQAAVKIIHQHPELRLYCAPCQDHAVTAARAAKAEVQQATMDGKAQPFKVVRITEAAGKTTELDLAYTYVKLDGQVPVYTNLAKLVSCPARDVPESIGPDGPPGAAQSSGPLQRPIRPRPLPPPPT